MAGGLTVISAVFASASGLLLFSDLLARFLRNGSGSILILKIAITIAIKNRSGKITGRLSLRNPIPIILAKSIRDFHFLDRITIETRFQDRKFRRNVKAGSDFLVKIDQRF